MAKIPTDSRERRDKTPIRKSIDLSFLSGGSTRKTTKAKSIETQSSCTVTGCSRQIWTAVCLSDTYYLEEDPNNEALLSYYDAVIQDPERMHWDSLALGKFDADKPVWDAPEYILVIMTTRLEQVTEEWLNTSSRLREKVENYIRTLTILLSHWPIEEKSRPIKMCPCDECSHVSSKWLNISCSRIFVPPSPSQTKDN